MAPGLNPHCGILLLKSGAPEMQPCDLICVFPSLLRTTVPAFSQRDELTYDQGALSSSSTR